MKMLVAQIIRVIGRADKAGVTLDDGNIIDLLADNIPAELRLLRAGLAQAGFAARFPKAIEPR